MTAIEDSEEAPVEFEASELGTKNYWDRVYQRDLGNYQDHGDIGEIWFGSDVEEEMTEWILMNAGKNNLKLLDVGCGNGHLLVELAALGFTNLHGWDYSEAAIKLSLKIAEEENICDQVAFSRRDILEPPIKGDIGTFDIILDKGTFDAISLAPAEAGDFEKRDKEKANLYVKYMAQLLVSGGTLLITSCNWTEQELISLFKHEFTFLDRIEYPSYSFGGHTGQLVTTLALKRL